MFGDQMIAMKSLYLVRASNGKVTGVVSILANLDVATMNHFAVIDICDRKKKGGYVRTEKPPAGPGTWCWRQTRLKVNDPGDASSPYATFYRWMEKKSLSIPPLVRTVRYVRLDNNQFLIVDYMFPTRGKGAMGRVTLREWAQDWASRPRRRVGQEFCSDHVRGSGSHGCGP